MRTSARHATMVGLFSLWTAACAFAQSECLVAIDHIPVAVKNLDLAAQTYKNLGFAIKPGRDHANGIRNQHVKFEDGAGIELLTAQRATDAWTTEYVRWIADGDGGAYLSFRTASLSRLKGELAGAGFSFSDDNGTLTLMDPKLNYVFFIEGNNQSPTDKPEHFQHANSARATIGAWIADGDNSPLIRLLAALGAKLYRMKVFVPMETTAIVARVQNGEVVFLPTSRRGENGRPVVGAVFQTRDLGALTKTQAPIAADVKTPTWHSLFIEPKNAHGMWLEFRAGQ